MMGRNSGDYMSTGADRVDKYSWVKKQLSWLSNVVWFLLAVIVMILHHNKWLEFLPDPWPDVLKEIAFAVIIAVVLIYTIDKTNKEKHEQAAQELIEKININLFHAIYKRSIPPDVFGEVEKCLLHAKVHRTDYELTYTLSRLDGEPDYLSCIAQSSYKLTNITDVPIQHAVQLLVEMPLEQRMMPHCHIDRVKMDGVVLEHDEIDKYVKPDADMQMKFCHIVDIPARGSIVIETKASLVKRSIDEEVWHSVLPSSGITLTVVTPNADLTLNATAFHSQKMEKVFESEVMSKWKLPYGIFPHQALLFWWKPKDTQGDLDLEVNNDIEGS